MKVYLAGKISNNDWRSRLLTAPLYFSEEEMDDKLKSDDALWIVNDGILDRHDYVGPFYFADCDHGCTRLQHRSIPSNDNWCGGCQVIGEPCSHGHWDGCCYYAGEDERKERILNFCLRSIDSADLVFAWIDCPDCFGTFAEIGYAYHAKKQIWIASPEKYKDLWFLVAMANKKIVHNDPAKAFFELVSNDLRMMAYSDYLRSDHWVSVKKSALRRADHRCQLCNTNLKKLHVHHRTYERRGCERDNDVIVLCEHCHAKFHDKLPANA